MLSRLAIANYRSLRDFVVPLAPLNLVTGPNASGKSNVYRALRLLADIAQGRIIPSLAREGGLESTLWAGPESASRNHPEHAVRLRDRSRAADAVEFGFRARPGNQARVRVER